jgi:Sec-independent protein translocase protein TatA
VGYFVLGPSDLYKLTKEIGKYVQNFRTFTTEATSLVENNLESNLQLEEIRKAQRDLNEAFNFRRSINVDEDSDAFAINAKSPRIPEPDFAPDPVTSKATAAPASGTTDATTAPSDEAAPAAIKKKVRRRRVKKKKVEEVVEEDPFVGFRADQGELANNVPDLAADDAPNEEGVRAAKSLEEANEELRRESMEEEAAERRKQRLERLENSYGQPAGGEDDALAQQELASTSGYDTSLTDADEQSRFQQQLGGTWNDRVLANEEDLTPLAEVMERLAILEDEKMSADQRLQEEFRLREENEERFYREKRVLLEEAATKIQAQAYGNVGPSPSTKA